jgi:ketosteroid isomerase-like protein
MADNTDVIKSFYGALEGGDLPGALDLLADDVVWIDMAGFPYGGTYHGPDAVRDGVFVPLGTEWAGFGLRVDEVLDAGDAVVGIGTYSGTYRATGKAMSARVTHVFRVRDGKIAGFEQFADTLKVVEAMS